MTMQVEITEAKSRLDELLDRVRAGEEILLSDGGKPVAMIAPAEIPSPSRGYGMFRGEVRMSDDFAEPLSDEELSEWEK